MTSVGGYDNSLEFRGPGIFSEDYDEPMSSAEEPVSFTSFLFPFWPVVRNVFDGIRRRWTEPHPIDFNKRREVIKKNLDDKAEMRNQTIAARVIGKQIGESGPERTLQGRDLIAGIVDGKFCYKVAREDLLPTTASSWTQFFTGLSLYGSSYLMWMGTKAEGIATTAGLRTASAYVIPKLDKIPYAPPIFTPIVIVGIGAGLSYAAGSDMTGVFLVLAGLAITGLTWKRLSKSFALMGVSGLKKWALPKGITEEQVRNCCKPQKAPIESSSQYIRLEPIDEQSELDEPLFLEIKKIDHDANYRFVYGEEKTPVSDWAKMANVKDDGDDDDDDEDDAKKIKAGKDSNKAEKGAQLKKKKKDKKDKVKQPELSLSQQCLNFISPSSLKNLAWKTALVTVPIVSTVASEVFTGEGITTDGSSTIAGASLKAWSRNQAVINGYAPLIASTALLYGVSLVDDPTAEILGYAYVIPLNCIFSRLNKDLKDLMVNGSGLKNPEILYMPPALQKLIYVLSGHLPQDVKPLSGNDPMKALLNKENNDTVQKTFDKGVLADETEVPVTLTISNGNLIGKCSDPELAKNVSMARLKPKKISIAAKIAGMGLSAAISYGSTFFTRYLNQGTVFYVPSDAGLSISEQMKELGDYEGVFPKIAIQPGKAFAKQIGKEIPFLLREIPAVLAIIGSIGADWYLIKNGYSLFLVSSPVAAFALGMWTKEVKQATFDKGYGKKGWIVPVKPKKIAKALGLDKKAEVTFMDEIRYMGMQLRPRRPFNIEEGFDSIKKDNVVGMTEEV